MKRILIVAIALVLFSCMAIAQTSPEGQPAAAPAGQASAAETGNNGAGLMAAILDKTIDAKKAKEGDQVVAKTIQDVKAANGQVIRRNSKLIGHVTQVQARGNGHDESTLGIVFDKIQLSKDQEIPFHAVIQALAPPPPVTVAPDAGGSSMPSGTPTASPGMGGSSGAGYGSPAGRPSGEPAGSAAANAGGTSSGSYGTSTAAPSGGAILTGTSQGAIGMKGIQLGPSTGTGQASMLTSTTSNVRLESGTRLLLRTTQQ